MTMYTVLLSEEAEKDLRAVFSYVAMHDSQEKTLQLIERLEETCAKLEKFLNCGHVPKESFISNDIRCFFNQS